MKLTVSEILRLDALAGSIVMSGDASDFERPVVGMQLWEGDDCPEDVREKLVFWQASHEQLDAATLCACACRSQEGGASGLVVLADSADCLAGVCTALDAPALPVIGLPWTGGALQALHQVESQLLERVMRVIERADLIHRELTVVAISGGDLEELTSTLADLIENPVSIRNMHLEVLTDASGGGELDEARRRSIAEGRVSRDVQEALERFDFQRRLRTETGPFRIPAIPEVGMRGRVLAPIRISEARYGYISIAECTRPLGALDMEAVERAALAAALIFSQRQALERDARRLRANFANELIYGSNDPDSTGLLDRRAHVLGFSTELFAVFIVGLEVADRLLAEYGARHHQVDLLLDQIVIAVEGMWPTDGTRLRALALSERDCVVVLQPVPSTWTATHQTLADHLTRVVGGEIVRRIERLVGEGSIWVGIGRPYPRLQVRRSYQESRQALLISRSLNSNQITYYEEIGFYRLLSESTDRAQLHRFVEEYLGPLIHYDEERRGELVRTLRLYLGSGGNKAKTAAQLPSHLNTVKYRLQQIREIAGRDPTDPEHQLSYRIALKIMDLNL